MSVHSHHNEQQRKTRKNTLKIVIITAAIGAVAAIGALLFDALWLFGWVDLKLQKVNQTSLYPFSLIFYISHKLYVVM
jgi:hypothetical protein